MSDQDLNNRNLEQLRHRIGEIDDELIALTAERLDIARAIGRVKIAKGLPIKDYKVEKDVIERAMEKARMAGVYEEMAAEVARLQIKYSVLAQDEYHVKSRAMGRRDRRKILIAGGRGHMGMWLSEFFASFGHAVHHFDPQASPSETSGFPTVSSLAGATRHFDVVCLATPISKTAALIDELALDPGTGLVFDVCSLKTPLLASFKAAEERGLHITSVHPMFGSDVELLAGRNIVFCESKHAQYVEQARQLFVDTSAHLSVLPLELHDKLMGYVLGLSHLVNLVFARVLTTSGISFTELQNVASTTFNAQLQVTGAVTEENQSLYYEIQAENGFSPELFQAIARELAGYEKAVARKDPDLFKRLMEASRRYFTPPQ